MEVWKIIFLSKWVICRFQPFIFQGVRNIFGENVLEPWGLVVLWFPLCEGSVSWVFPQHHRMRIPRHHQEYNPNLHICHEPASVPVDPCHIFCECYASFSKGKIWDFAWIDSPKVNFVAFLGMFFCNDGRFSGDLRFIFGGRWLFFVFSKARVDFYSVPMCLVNVLPGKERNEMIIKSDSAWKGSIEAGAENNVQVPSTKSWNVGGSI